MSVRLESNRKQGGLITPEQAKRQISSLGYKSWTDIPLGQSHYLDALVTAATNHTPLDLSKLLQQTQRSVRGRT